MMNFRLRSSRFLGCLLLLFLLLVPVSVFGSRVGPVTMAIRQDGDRPIGEVAINGVPVVRIRTGSGDLTSIERARIITGRIVRLTQSGLAAERIKPGYLNSSAVVNAGAELLATADAESAALNGCTPSELALLWANNLRRALGAAPLAGESGGEVIRGWASWYGPGFHGRETANGETFDQDALTAAHRTLPFGSEVKVTNTYTGQSVVVRINDRGPFVKGRIIDLSRGAARAVGLTAYGIAPVELRVSSGE